MTSHADRLKELYPTIAATWPQKDKTMKVYSAINQVQRSLVKTGISKDRTNTQGSGYKFRGIDDVYNAVSPLLAEHGLCILPRMISRACEERQSRAGGALFYVTVEAEFDFVAVEDGSKHTVKTFGEAMDSGDKATNKAMSAAYKYAAFQAFAIPTEGDNDADAHTPQVAPKRQSIRHTPTDEVVEIPDDRKTYIELQASIAANKFKAGEKDAAYDILEQFFLDNEEYMFLWQTLKSNATLRAYIKFRRENAKQPAAEEAF